MWSEEKLKLYSRVLYTAGAVALILPLSQVVFRAYPAQMHNLQWRFGVMGIAFTSIDECLVGLAMITGAAALRGSWGTVRAIGVLALVAAVVAAGAAGLYVLDAVQLRELVREADKARVSKGLIAGGVAAAVAVLAFLIIGRAAWNMSRPGDRTQGVFSYGLARSQLPE